MKKRIKKGFTLVELLVVIAILAILSTVAIVGYNSFTEKAKESADISAVKQMNTALAAETDDPDNIIEAVKVLNDAGFNTEKGLTPVYKNHNFYWYKVTNEVVYVNEEDGGFELVYPEIDGFPSSITSDLLPLNVGVKVVLDAPKVEGATNATINSTSSEQLPDDINDFNSLITWIGDGTDVKVKSTIDGSPTLGIELSGGDIKLTENTVVDVNNGDTMRFHITGEVTLDLNGYTITQQCGANALSGYALFCVRDGGVLNIIDSSENKNGAIEAPLLAVQVNSGGVVNMYDGTIRAAEERTARDIQDDYIWCVGMYGGTFNMYGGTIDARCDDVSNDYAFNGWGISTSICNLYAGNVIGLINDVYTGTVNHFGATITAA